MKSRRKIFYLFLIFNFTFFILREAGAETTACSYMYYNQSPVSMGMGGLDDIFEASPGASGNPALLAFCEGGELSGGVENDAMEAAMSRVSAIFRIKKAGIAFGVFSYEQSFPIVNSDGTSYSGFSQSGEINSLSIGYPILKNLSFGLGMRNVNERFFVADSESYDSESYADSTSYADMGLFFRHRGFRAAFRAANFGEAKIWDDEPLPSYGGFSIGYAGDRLKAGISAGSDQVTAISRLGLEYALSGWFAVRAGMDRTDTAADGMFMISPSLGFSISYGAFAFDFAAVTHPDLGNRAMTALRYNWGRKKVKPASPVITEDKKTKPERTRKAAPAEIAPFDGKPAQKIPLPAAPEGERVNIAVTDFEARAPLSQSEAAFISDFVRSDFVKSGRFNVIEKNNMDKVLAEQGFQQTGCSSAECAVAIGKILNVKLMTVGSCGQLLGKYIITMNIVDVESAKIIFSDDASVADPNDLRNKITELIGSFLNTVK
ncbi:MAG: hypothetical protein CVU78_07200 [Elusimicrobia bacterium HGW-Elusimicrobia-2]|nr:MAG: hypothetical protein CVU78_07200 [Elusimicrobia bacterium HGW-Elusimicrobia-2]